MIEEKIRLAKTKDAKEILKLFNSNKNLWGNNYINYGKEDILDYLKAKINRMFVYEFNNKIKGVLLAQFWKKYVYIHTIVVDKKDQNHGIATKLMNYLEHHAKSENKNLIEMDVETTNKKMRKFVKTRDYKHGNKFIYYLKEI